MWRITIALVVLMLFSKEVTGQSTYQSIVRDTIVMLKSFPRNTYLLDGKKLNLSVMEWFMTDFPDAHDQINLAILTEQTGVACYSIGALFGLTGLLVYSQDPHLGNDLLELGSIGLGTGVVFQIFSGAFKKKAVRFYNKDVQQFYQKQGNQIHVKLDKQGFGVAIRFE